MQGYSPKVRGSTECRTVNVVVSYTHDNGVNYMLILHQAIYIPDMKVNLICPMQLRDNAIKVNDLPKSMCQEPTINDHAIIVDDLTMTLSIRGSISFSQWQSQKKKNGKVHLWKIE